MQIRAMIAAAALAVAAWATPAHASSTIDETGNDLLSICTDESISDQFLCLGYVRGLWVGADALFASKDITLCTPETVKLGQFRDILILWLRRHPVERSKSAIIITMLAMNDAWACQ